MKAKRILSLLLVLVMLVCMLPTAFAAEVAAAESTEPLAEETTPPAADVPDDSPTQEETSPVVDPDLDPALAELGFVSDEIVQSYVAVEDPGEYGISTFAVSKIATLRDCQQMNFITSNGLVQGFHYADEDQAAPWDYMNMIYCLENKKSYSTGSGHAGSSDLPIDGTGNNHGEKVWYNLSSQQRVAIGLVLLYGAPTKLWDESWGINAAGDHNRKNPNIGYRFATQALIWEFAAGLREPVAPYKLNSTYWYDLSVGQCVGDDGTDHFLVAYNSIISDMQLHNVIPSFASDFATKAPEIQLAGNTATVTDANGVLHKFDFPSTSNVTYSKNGNTLTITATGAVPTDVQTATVELPDPQSSLYEVWYNQYDSSKQALIKVSVPASDPVPAYFKLKASSGNLSLKKTTEDGKNLAGWQFGIYSDAACTQLISGPHTSDANGAISVTGLTAGDVWVKELGNTDAAINAKYYCSSQNPQKVTITAGGTATVTFENKLNLGICQIIKKATNGGAVNGWHFTVKDASGNTVGSYVTDASGVIALKLLPGTYTIVETDGKYEYWNNDPNPTKTVTVKANETASVTFTNSWFGKTQIVKKATNGGSVAGWHFEVRDSSDNVVGNYTTDASGIITIDLQPGQYTVVETDGAYPYWHNDPTPSKMVTVKAGETSSVTFENRWVGKAKVIKVLSNPEAGTVAGWTFTIHKLSGTETQYVTTVTTGEDGTITYDLEPGEYLITEELDEGSMWECTSGISQTITVTAGQTVEVSFTNALRPGKIQIQKVDTQGQPLAGVEFKLEWSEDGENWKSVTFTDATAPQIGGCTTEGVTDGKLKSDANGAVVFDGLHPLLQYRLTETATLDGYQLLAGTAYEGELPLDEDFTVTLTVVNAEVFTLPKTGSKSLVLMPIALVLCIATCAGALVLLRKKEGR